MAMKSAANLAERYLDLLAEEGYRPKLEGSSDVHAVISFKSEGESFMVFVDEDDESFLHVGSFYELGKIEADSALSLANELNEQLKVIKITVSPQDNAVRFHVESFLDEAPAMSHIELAVSSLREAAVEFFEPARSADHLDA